MITVVSVHVYPIKSARGFAPGRARVGDRGFVGDRRWMVVDPAGRFVTQREVPRMARIGVEVVAGGIRIEEPGMGSLVVNTPSEDGEGRVVEVWGDRVDAVAAGEEAAGWMTRFLERPCALVYMPERSVREHGGGRVGFADGYPFLIVSRASLSELHRRGVPVGMERFRPNIVVDGCGPFEEDRLEEVRIGAVTMRLVKACLRCSITTVDQERGEVAGKEPLATLAAFRSGGGGVMFGMNAVHEGEGEVGVGDEVVVCKGGVDPP